MKKISRTVKFSTGQSVLWTLLMGILAVWSVDNIHKHTLELSLYEARAFFEEIVTTRTWNAPYMLFMQKGPGRYRILESD